MSSQGVSRPGATVLAQEPFASASAVYEIDERSVDWSPVKGLIVNHHRLIRVNRAAGIEAGRIRIWDTFFRTGPYQPDYDTA